MLETTYCRPEYLMGRHDKPLRFSTPLVFGITCVGIVAVIGAPGLSLSFEQKFEVSDEPSLSDITIQSDLPAHPVTSALAERAISFELREPRPEVRMLAEKSISTTSLAKLMRSGKLLRVLESSGELHAAGGLLLKEFSASIDLLQLWKVIALQGEEASWHLISEMGLSASGVEKLCQDSRFAKPLVAARELLEVANRGKPQDIAAISSWTAFETYPNDSRFELARATLRAVAAGCIALDLTQHQESVGVHDRQIVWREG